MAEYRITIDLVVDADNEEDAYNKVCKTISASQLSREVCEIELGEDD